MQEGFNLDKKVECAKKAGFVYPHQSAKATLESPRINEIVQAEMVEQKLTPKKLVEELKRLATESMNPFRPKMPDNRERRESVKMGFQLYDAFPAKKVDVRKTEARFTLDSEDIRKLDEETGRKTVIEHEPIEEEEVEPF